MSELDSVSQVGECMSLLDECKWYIVETTAKLNDWVKSTIFFFSVLPASRVLYCGQLTMTMYVYLGSYDDIQKKKIYFFFLYLMKMFCFYSMHTLIGHRNYHAEIFALLWAPNSTSYYKFWAAVIL